MRLEDLKVGDCFALLRSEQGPANRWFIIVDVYVKSYEKPDSASYQTVISHDLDGGVVVWNGTQVAHPLAQALFLAEERVVEQKQKAAALKLNRTREADRQRQFRAEIARW